MVVCSGGMSVDPDDRTPGGIRDTGVRVVTYGAPVLPGAMLLIAYFEKDGKSDSYSWSAGLCYVCETYGI